MKISDILISIIVNGYSLLFSLACKLVIPFLNGMGQRRGWDLDLRQKLPTSIRDHRNKNVVWVHAASLGEVKLLCKFLTILEQRNPDDMYVATATTRTGVEYLKKSAPASVCAIGFFPLDTIPLVRKILRHFQISRVWLLETELWPSMLWICKDLGIPLGIINARMEEKSFNRYCRFKFLLSYFFEGFDIVLAQDETYAQRFQYLGVKQDRVHVVGNIKGHVVIRRPHVDEWKQARQALGLTERDLVITCGCLHEGEGDHILQCFTTLKNNGITCKIIVVPRYLEEVPELVREIGDTMIRLTDTNTMYKWDMCIIEKMGILDNMYMIADAAIVGGTFVNIGGHNVWDAARFGIPVFFGPDYHTQKESCEKLLESGVGFKADNGKLLADLITEVLKTDPGKFVHAQLQFMENINNSESVLGQLLP